METSNGEDMCMGAVKSDIQQPNPLESAGKIRTNYLSVNHFEVWRNYSEMDKNMRSCGIKTILSNCHKADARQTVRHSLPALTFLISILYVIR